MIVLIHGGLGSGKTCMLTRYAYLSHLMGKRIISNYKLENIPFTNLDMVDLYLNHPDMNNYIIVADELYTFMDCRSSMSVRNKLESYSEKFIFENIYKKLKTLVNSFKLLNFIDKFWSEFETLKTEKDNYKSSLSKIENISSWSRLIITLLKQ